MGRLTPLAVKNAKPGRYADGNGLYLLVKPSGAKSWLLRMQVDGRRRDFGLGAVGKVPLAAARGKASELREKVFEGHDPVLARKARQAIPTFEQASRQCVDDKGGDWVEQHRRQWLASLEDHAFRSIGSVRVDLIDAALIADAIRRSWAEVPNTARRVLQRIGYVLDFARAMGWRTADNPLRSVRLLLPDTAPDKKHFAAEPQEKLPTIVAKLARPGANIRSLATAFCILTAARPSEVRFMKWEDVDLAARAWTVPADRMKGRKAHRVPLSSTALAILQQMAGMFGGREVDWVFPGRSRSEMSPMNMGRAFRESGGSTTVHGSARSTFTDWAEENTGVKSAVIQACLAHKTPDATERAYRRTTFYDQRARLMQMWSDHLLSSAVTNVVSIAAAAG